MFERFNGDARKVVLSAQSHASDLDHEFIDVGHLLLAILEQKDGIACRAIALQGFDLSALRETVAATMPRGAAHRYGHIPFTPEAKKCYEDSYRESLKLGLNYIGSEHMLLAILHERSDYRELLGQIGLTHKTVLPEVVKLIIDNPDLAAAGTVDKPPLRPPRLVFAWQIERYDKLFQTLSHAYDGGSSPAIVREFAAALASACRDVNRPVPHSLSGFLAANPPDSSS